DVIEEATAATQLTGTVVISLDVERAFGPPPRSRADGPTAAAAHPAEAGAPCRAGPRARFIGGSCYRDRLAGAPGHGVGAARPIHGGGGFDGCPGRFSSRSPERGLVAVAGSPVQYSVVRLVRGPRRRRRDLGGVACHDLVPLPHRRGFS